MKLWEHQSRTALAVHAAIDNGAKRICVQSPTGTGKSVIMGLLAKAYLNEDRKVVCYTNRRQLLDQTTRNFGGFDLDHGIRAAGHEDERWKDFQISSIQTEVSRLKKPERHRGWELHRAELILIDEAHVNLGPEVRDIIARHIEMGGVVVGFTATPVDMAQVYDQLIVGCTVEEGRKCGALVPAVCYGPDEPDLRQMGIKLAADDYSENQQKKAMMTPTLFGRVFEWWNRLNPSHKPTIGFAPGVAESLWLAQEFWKRGISAAHIDGSEVWMDNNRSYTSQEARDDILAAHKEGRIKVIFNRFVLREGIDMPWAEVGILATIYGSVSSYLQSVGRLLRASPSTGKTRALIIDHGGNWHRFGDPNADREWYLEYTSSMINGMREEELRKLGPGKEPVRCPWCAMILQNRVCECGFTSMRQTWPRPVVQVNGTLKELNGSLFRKRAIDTRSGARENWIKMYYRAFNSKNRMTFRQAIACYQSENQFQYPDHSWPFMPFETIDLFRRVADVPRERLRK